MNDVTYQRVSKWPTFPTSYLNMSKIISEIDEKWLCGNNDSCNANRTFRTWRQICGILHRYLLHYIWADSLSHLVTEPNMATIQFSLPIPFWASSTDDTTLSKLWQQQGMFIEGWGGLKVEIGQGDKKVPTDNRAYGEKVKNELKAIIGWQC